ncbi:MAG TPA: peptidoglycan DD-metalloendopeptidase family protein [Frankiaceae bacterium]|nr:peptidoglycan DD-metalloendopeptidase family protein [Frankiaceae bacterium]
MPQGRRIGRRSSVVGSALLAALISAPLLAAPAHSAEAPSGLGQLQSQTSAAADDLGVRDAEAENAAAALADVRSRIAAAQSTLDGAQGQLQSARADLTTRQDTLGAAQSDQRLAQDRVDAATASLDDARNQLRGMVRSALQNGFGGDLDVLMQSGTPEDLADRMGILDHLSTARKQRIDGLATARNALVDQVHQLDLARQRSADAVTAANTQVTKVDALVTTAQTARQQLVALQTDRQNALDQARIAADASRARYAALQQASSDLASLLAARSRANPGGPPRPQAGSGGLIMPTTGVFTSPYGYRNDPFGGGRRFHAGQDIAAPLGTPIYAATAGTVAYAGWESGYGNYTCIDRGSGFATCYGHQSQILVTVGQSVQQGQEIGLVGSTGNSTGPHLHFEVRLNGQPVDPVPYLP